MPRKGKEPESPISSAYTTSTNLSPPFTYSTTRPPTSISEIGFSTSLKSPKSLKYTSQSYGYSYSKSPFPPPSTPLPPLPSALSTSTTRHSHIRPSNDDDGEDTGDLYNRSDWLSTSGSQAYTSNTNKWTRSSYKPSSRPFRSNSNPNQNQKDENQIEDLPTSKGYLTPYTAKTPKTSKTGKVQFADEQDIIIDSPNQITPALKSIGNKSIPAAHGAGRKNEKENRKSTLPSIISLSQLTKKDNTNLKITNHTPEHGMNSIGNSRQTTPATSPSTQLLPPIENHDLSLNIPHIHNSGNTESSISSGIEDMEGIHQRKPYIKSRTPEPDLIKLKQKTLLLNPKEQNKLGRMSVAPPRYTLPPQRKSKRVTRFDLPQDSDDNDRNSKNKNKDKPKSISILTRIKYSKISKIYLTFKPFISPILSLICALILTVTHGLNPNSTLSEFLLINKDVFDISRAGGTDLILGPWGWCQSSKDIMEPQCQLYDYRDFADGDLRFTIPGNSSLDTLSSLLTALTVLTWLLSAYQTITAFLHFYLFFALSIPFNRLIEVTSPPELKSKQKNHKKINNKDKSVVRGSVEFGQNQFIAEVDLRVKCERFPYESYYWVWWAWWGHRRSPIQAVFGMAVGVLGIATFAMTYKFKSDIINATGSDGVAFGHGGYMPLMTTLFTLDTFLSSFEYFWNFKTYFTTFLNPPSPSPRVLLLPESENNLFFKHHRRTGLQSFFAPISATRELSKRIDTFIDPLTGKPTIHTNYNPDNNEFVENKLDEETIRWLSLYPYDLELVNLISDLRKGKIHLDFLLSEVGLLYLRPLNEEEMALLIPPKGIIRGELLQDSHLDYYPGLSKDPSTATVRGGREGEGEGEEEKDAHNDLNTMIKILNQNFWWNGMEIDSKEFIENCQICFDNLRKDTGILNKQFPLN